MKESKNKCALDEIPVVEDVVIDEDRFYEEWREQRDWQEVAAANRADRACKQKELSEVIHNG